MGMGGMLKAATLTGSLAETGTLLLQVGACGVLAWSRGEVTSHVHPTAAQSTISKFPMFWKRGLLLGAGTFGKVYRGLNVLTGELFAVKQIPSQGPCGDLSQGLDTLAREVDLMRELRHENIVRYLGTEREEGTLYVHCQVSDTAWPSLTRLACPDMYSWSMSLADLLQASCENSERWMSRWSLCTPVKSSRVSTTFTGDISSIAISKVGCLCVGCVCQVSNPCGAISWAQVPTSLSTSWAFVNWPISAPPDSWMARKRGNWKRRSRQFAERYRSWHPK